MSRGSKIVLAASIAFTGTIITYVHWKQNKDRAVSWVTLCSTCIIALPRLSLSVSAGTDTVTLSVRWLSDICHIKPVWLHEIRLATPKPTLYFYPVHVHVHDLSRRPWEWKAMRMKVIDLRPPPACPEAVSSHVGPFPCGPVMWAPRQLRQSCRPRHARAGTGDLTERGVYVALTSWPRRGWLTSVLSLYDN